LELRRSDLYEKELDVVMSTSYGPGRYDPAYELEGRDYPVAYVRWTENRNMAEYLRLLADGAVRLDALPRQRYRVDDAGEAYGALAGPGKPLLALLEYPERDERPSRRVVLRTLAANEGVVRVALVGAGGFAQASHVPNLLRLR